MSDGVVPTKTDLKSVFSIKSIIQTSSIAQIYKGTLRSNENFEVIIKRSLRSRCLSKEIQYMERAHRICPEHCLPVIYKSSCKKYVNFAIPKFGVSLYDFMVNRRKVLNLEEAKIIFKQVFACLKKLVDHNLYHLDVKEENILVDPETLQVKIIDFGCSSETPIFNKQLVGSKEFCSPEVYTGESNFKNISKHDVWSLGVTIISSMTGNTPYESMDGLLHGDEEFRIRSGHNADVVFTRELKFLLSCMLEINYEERISFDSLGKTAFFRS